MRTCLYIQEKGNATQHVYQPLMQTTLIHIRTTALLQSYTRDKHKPKMKTGVPPQHGQ